MQEETKNNIQEPEEKEVDLLQLAAQLWSQRRKLIKWSVCGAIIGLVVAFSIPREYTTTVKLAPEINDDTPGGKNLSSLSSMAGLSLSAGGEDALFPMIYPDVVGSTAFLHGLCSVKVKTDKGGKPITVAQYLEDDTRSPWWGMILGLPSKLIGLLRSSDDESNGAGAKDGYRLTKDESKYVKALSNCVQATYDNKTSVVTLDVTMQDPLVSALLADSVVARLKDFVTEYRTNKARQDLEYAKTLNQEARERYYKAQQMYAYYLDHNQNIIFRSAQVERERLENETALAFNVYNTTAQMVERAQAKVQEKTPVLAVFSPSIVPDKPSKPRKAVILVAFTFLGFVACAAWLLYLQPMLKKFKEKREETREIENTNED